MRPILPTVLTSCALLVTAAPAARAADGAATTKPVIACDGHDRNLQVYLRMHDVLFMERDGSRVEEFYAPEVISHNQDTGGGTIQKVKSSDLAAMWAASKRNNPERVLADDLIICQGPYVVVRTVIHSSDRTGFAGHPPTGKPYAISGIDIYRFESGKVVERWGNSDLAGLLSQIGYTFTPPQPVATPPAAK